MILPVKSERWEVERFADIMAFMEISSRQLEKYFLGFVCEPKLQITMLSLFPFPIASLLFSHCSQSLDRRGASLGPSS